MSTGYRIEIEIDYRDILNALSIGEILDYFEDDNGFLERIGIETAKDYWDLKE